MTSSKYRSFIGFGCPVVPLPVFPVETRTNVFSQVSLPSQFLEYITKLEAVGSSVSSSLVIFTPILSIVDFELG